VFSGFPPDRTAAGLAPLEHNRISHSVYLGEALIASSLRRKWFCGTIRSYSQSPKEVPVSFS
jgi:hypothetical protein